MTAVRLPAASRPAPRRAVWCSILLAAMVATGCGGGGGSGAAPPVGGGTPPPGGGPPATLNDTVGAIPDYANVQVKTVMPTAMVAPLPSARATAIGKTYFGRYGYLRSWAVFDLDGDGLDDIVVAPTFFDQKPSLPVEVWINRGDGTFENRSAQWFAGSVPTTGNVVSVPLVADFNGDGKPDLFLSDSGQEESDCTASPCPGASNHLFLSDAAGTWHDASAGLANNPPRFNHVTTAIGDVNGDGHADIAVPNLGEVGIVGDGVVLQVNDGTGAFADRSAWLSDEIGYLPFSYQFSGARPATYDRHGTGATAIVDVDGDGKPELVTCSYTRPDRFTKQKTIRFSRWNPASSTIVEVGRFVLTGPLAQIAGATTSGVFANDDGTLGCAGVWVADIDGDGIKDLMVLWERWDDGYVQLLRGTGNLQFEDVTVAALGAHLTTFSNGTLKWIPSAYAFQDVNGDGFPDIVMRASGVTESRLAGGVPTVLINDGHGKFTAQAMKVDGATLSKAGVEALTGCTFCNHSVFFGRFVPRSDGRKTLDMLLMNTNEDIGGAFAQERSVSLRVFRAR